MYRFMCKRSFCSSDTFIAVASRETKQMQISKMVYHTPVWYYDTTRRVCDVCIARPVYTGIREVWRYELSDGSNVVLTPDHDIVDESGKYTRIMSASTLAYPHIRHYVVPVPTVTVVARKRAGLAPTYGLQMQDGHKYVTVPVYNRKPVMSTGVVSGPLADIYRVYRDVPASID